MKSSRKLLIATSAAPELLAALSAYGLWLVRPAIFASIGSSLKGDPEVWTYLNVLPIALVAACFRFGAKIRAPLEAQYNKKLYEWPDYKLLVVSVNIALLIGALAAVTQVSLWMFGKQLRDDLVGLLFSGSTLILLVATAGLAFASMKIGEILTEHG